MSNLVRPQVFNGLLEKAGLAQLDPGEISVLFSSIPPQYGQSLVAGLQQKDATSTSQIRAWSLALKLHSRIIKSISNTISLSDVYATCKLKGAKLVGDLLASVEAGDANATEFLTAHLRDGFKAVRAQGLPALLGLSSVAAPSAGDQQEQRQSAPSNSGINSMPPPGDDPDRTSDLEHARQQHRPAPQQERHQHHVQPQRHNQQQNGGQQRQHQQPPRSDNRSQSQQARDYEGNPPAH
ncbi:hypothetical protein [Xanthomonas perforans]|uniref:hypothetical protein n=1 Tax=Xanthomonas perforans TaxID=442694 RepID=UPI00321B83EC